MFAEYYIKWLDKLGLKYCGTALEAGLTEKRIPQSLRDYYRIANDCEANQNHNRLLGSDDLIEEDGFLIFMEEYQSVVHWGVKIDQVDQPDPIVYQRNNSNGQWYSEESVLSRFLMATWWWTYTGEDRDRSYFT